MKKIKKWLKKHWLSVIMAILLGGNVVYNNVLNINKQEANIMSHNPQYTNVHIENVIFNRDGSVKVEGAAIDTLTKDSVTWATQSYLKIQK